MPRRRSVRARFLIGIPHRGRSNVTTTILEQLTHLIHDKLGVALEVIDPDTPFGHYGLGVFTIAELMFEIDHAIHVTVPDQAVTTVTTLSQLAVLIDGLPAVPQECLRTPAEVRIGVAGTACMSLRGVDLASCWKRLIFEGGARAASCR